MAKTLWYRKQSGSNCGSKCGCFKPSEDHSPMYQIRLFLFQLPGNKRIRTIKIGSEICTEPRPRNKSRKSELKL